ncbi:MAG TPA: MarR family transcriptional regulator [Casimicrobiaceae bacterium]
MSAPSYWFGAASDEPAARPTPVELLDAVRRHREAEAAMRRRTQRIARMGENDLRALRWIVAQEGAGRAPSAAGLARALGMSTAASAKLVARLEAAGHVRRERHADDGRVMVLHSRPTAHARIREVLAPMHERMLRLAESLDPVERRTVVDFLDRLGAIVGDPDPQAPQGRDG